MRNRWRTAALALIALLIASCWLGPEVVLQAATPKASACRVMLFAESLDSVHYQVDCAKPTPAMVNLNKAKRPE